MPFKPYPVRTLTMPDKGANKPASDDAGQLVFGLHCQPVQRIRGVLAVGAEQPFTEPQLKALTSCLSGSSQRRRRLHKHADFAGTCVCCDSSSTVGSADAGGTWDYGRLEITNNGEWTFIAERTASVDLGRRGAQSGAYTPVCARQQRPGRLAIDVNRADRVDHMPGW